MEVLDSSIANVALPHIAGSLGASSEESTWVITSYLVSSAIVLPMSGALCANISETSRSSTITVGRGKKSHFDEHKQDKQFFRSVGSFGA